MGINRRQCVGGAMARQRFAIACLGLFSLMPIAGCGGDALARHAISGTVNVDGAPLETGNISFQPTEKQPTSSGAFIAGGKFSVPRDGGLTNGTYRVVVNAPMPAIGGTVPTADALPGEPPPPPL